MATVSCHGPMRVTAPDGSDITPQSALRQALLAVLLHSPGQIRARRALQDMFWGGASPDRAAASLRTALYLLRQDLAVLGADAVRADRQVVSLAPGRVQAAPARAGAVFLEAIDLGLADCEGFEDWLRLMRGTAADPAPPAAETHRAAAPARRGPVLVARTGPMALGILPPEHAGLSRDRLIRADGMMDAIVRFLAQTTFLDVHDLRCAGAEVLPLPIATGQGPTHWLQSVLEQSSGATLLRLRLQEAATRRLLWLSPPLPLADLPPGPQDDTTAFPLGEAVVQQMQRSPAQGGATDLFPLTALAAMFGLDRGQLLATEAQLERMKGRGAHPVIDCLHLFAQVFKRHEGVGTVREIDPLDVCAHVASLAVSDPMLPLCQSLLGYALHMLSAENDLAQHLTAESMARAPHLALNLDHVAVLCLARGDLDGAQQAFDRCLLAGAQSPWRYTYEVTGAMIHLVRGDWQRSLYFANQALFRQPRYLGALRYAMAGLALAGKPRDAHRLLARIHGLNPDFDLGGWADGVMRRTSPIFAQALHDGLRRGDLL